MAVGPRSQAPSFPGRADRGTGLPVLSWMWRQRVYNIGSHHSRNTGRNVHRNCDGHLRQHYSRYGAEGNRAIEQASADSVLHLLVAYFGEAAKLEFTFSSWRLLLSTVRMRGLTIPGPSWNSTINQLGRHEKHTNNVRTQDGEHKLAQSTPIHSEGYTGSGGGSHRLSSSRLRFRFFNSLLGSRSATNSGSWDDVHPCIRDRVCPRL